MLKIYGIIIILAVLGGVGFGAKYYYDTTQNTIKTLRENNARLEGAVETAENSVKTLQQDFAKMSELNSKLQKDLQKAEAYSDELRGKLSRLDLVQDALKDPDNLQGRMNGATAKLWREFMANSGSTIERPYPEWLRTPTGEANSDSNGRPANPSGTSSKAEATTTE